MSKWKAQPRGAYGLPRWTGQVHFLFSLESSPAGKLGTAQEPFFWKPNLETEPGFAPGKETAANGRQEGPFAAGEGCCRAVLWESCAKRQCN